MKSITFLILSVSLFFASCSKKEPVNNQSGNNQKPQQQQTSQNNTQNQNPQMIDFSWSESGKEQKLSDYKGKVIVVNFWATWCGPCRRELPDLSQIAKDLKEKDFKMVGVSVDRDNMQLTSFLKANPLSYSVVHNPDNLLSQYMSATGMTDDVIPQTFVIDKSGKIVETLVGSHSKEDFLKIINKYL